MLLKKCSTRPALPVDPTTEAERVLAVRAGRDIGPGAAVGGEGSDRVRVIGAVSDQRGAGREFCEQALGGGRIAGLSGGQRDAHRPALGIDERVELRRQPAAGTSHAAIVRAPLFPLAPC